MRKKPKIFGILNGYAFAFEHSGHTIEAWFSTWSGAEKVCVDGDLVVEQKTYSRESQSTFSLGGQEYSIVLDAQSILKGPFVCTLAREGVPVLKQRLVFPRSKYATLRFMFFVAIGVGFGLAHSYYQFSWWYALPSLAFIFVLNFIGRGSMQPVIEDVACV